MQKEKGKGKRTAFIEDGEREPDPESSDIARENKTLVTNLRKSVSQEALRVIHEVMPQKIIELTKVITENELFQLPSEDGEHFELKQESAVTKKRKLDDDGHAAENGIAGKDAASAAANPSYVKCDATISCNEIVLKQQAFLKKEIQYCLSLLVKIKIWIQLNIPKVEDGNNFGVSIQEETVNELSRAEDTGFNVMESMNKYFMTRGKLVSRVAKYPGLQDYLVSVRELDRKERVSMCLSLNDLRNNYFIMYDSITKNMEKLKMPRSNAALPFT